ncbi:MAG: hypothetical protein IJP80_01735 [Bacteroidales bacterium]|nr:hypothetical protein [Bacteroidales bacterium]
MATKYVFHYLVVRLSWFAVGFADAVARELDLCAMAGELDDPTIVFVRRCQTLLPHFVWRSHCDGIV